MTDLVVDADPVVVLQSALTGVVGMHVDDWPTALQTQHGAVITPGGVDGPSSVRRVPEERVFLFDWLFECREGLAQFDVPGMVDVELLAAGERTPRTFLFKLMLKGGIGNAFLD